MAVVLVYTPFVRRARDVESVMLALRDQGHTVISLTQTTGEHFNSFLRENGIEAYSNYIGDTKGAWYYLRHLLFFISFCRKHRVQVVFSHLDPANFVASIGQYFIKAKVFLFRHHINEAALYRYQQSFSYRITNALAKHFVVVSNQAKEYMISHEKVDRRKIRHVNLAYDFNLFNTPFEKDVAEIRRRVGGTLILVTVCRLTTYKRPDFSVSVAERLIARGIDVHLLILGEGPMEKDLRNYIENAGLVTRITLTGHVYNVLDYIAAADFVVHPSLLESSCVVVKEAGYLRRPVVVCRGVGDFDDYMLHDENSFVVDPDSFVDDAAKIIEQNFQNVPKLRKLGNCLHNGVIKRFDIKQVIRQYDFI